MWWQSRNRHTHTHAICLQAGDLDLNFGSGRYTGEGNGNPLQYSCLENSMDGAAFSSVQCSRSVVSDSLRPHEPQRQASLSNTNSQSPPKPMSIESMIPSKSRLVGYNPWGRSCDRTERLMLNLAMGEFLSLGSRIAYSSSNFVWGPLSQLVYSESLWKCKGTKFWNRNASSAEAPILKYF